MEDCCKSRSDVFGGSVRFHFVSSGDTTVGYKRPAFVFLLCHYFYLVDSLTEANNFIQRIKEPSRLGLLLYWSYKDENLLRSV